jgi:hypothetical protein
MKPLILVTALALFTGLLSAEPASAITVKFVDADQFTDFSDSYSFPDSGRSQYSETLIKYLSERAARKLPKGWRLEVVVTDVDMAGEFEPWRMSSSQDVRIVKDLYPPRIDLSFRIWNSAGTVVAEGNRKLRDMGFMFSARMLDSDPLKHEKRLLDRWISRELGSGLGV